MRIIDAFILGVVEGLTEFLPISSTFHLLFTTHLLHIHTNEFTKLFEVFIQSGAILAVVWLYRRDIVRRAELIVKTIIAFLPTAMLGVLLYGPIKRVFFASLSLQIAVFIFMGFVFLFFELLVRRGRLRLGKTLATMTWSHALLIGTAQVLSFFPGVSRAAVVILIMMALGYRRAEAAFFSFFLSIPTILSAGLFDLYKSRGSLVSLTDQIIPLGLGFVISLLVAVMAIRWFITYLQTHTLNIFAFYRFTLGAGAILIYFFIR